MQSRLAVLLGALALFLVGTPAQASLIGDTISVTCVASFPVSPSDCLVGGGPASVLVGTDPVPNMTVGTGTTSGPGDILISIAATSITLTAPNGASFAGFNQLITFNPLNSIITSASFVTSGTFNPVLVPADLTFDADSVSLELGGTGWFAGTSPTVTINLTTDDIGGPTVPEPGTMVLFGAGLLGMGLMRRRAAAKK